MRTLFIRLSVALLTFLVGVSAAALLRSRPECVPAYRFVWKMERTAPAADLPPIFPGPTHCTARIPDTHGGTMSAEDRAVLAAEEFIRRNGYTARPPDSDNISYETVEPPHDLAEILRLRHDSLMPKAYGVLGGRYGSEKGFTVVFRLRGPSGTPHELGRAVTMDENFRRLRVEHKPFPLGNVRKRL